MRGLGTNALQSKSATQLKMSKPSVILNLAAYNDDVKSENPA